MKNSFVALLIILVFAFCASAQKLPPSPTPTPTPERSREIVRLINDARLAAPELTVDTLLKLLETNKVTDKTWRGELLEEALRTIDAVQYPMPMAPAYGGKVERNNELLDTELAALFGAFTANLDQLSLKGRVITLFLQSDPDRAKRMIFQLGGRLGLKPRSCEDALTYSPDSIYAVVGNVATAVFSPQQVAEGQRALFVAPWIENIESPRQIYPALGLLQQMRGPMVEQEMLTNEFAKAIDRDFKDDRSFTYLWYGVTARLGKLTGGDPDTLKSELITAYRGMMLKNLRGVRCKDNEVKKDDELPDYVEAANKLLGDKPLTLDDAITQEVAGTAKLNHLLKKPEFLKLRDEVIPLRGIEIVDNKIVSHDLGDLEWAAKVTEFVDRVLALQGSDNETESELLFIKGACLGVLITYIKPGDLRTSIVRRYLRMLANSSLQRSNFIVWRQWIAGVERDDPDSFAAIVPEFPNPNLKLIIASKKFFDTKKDAKAPTPQQAQPAEGQIKP